MKETGVLTAKACPILTRAVEEGVAPGWRRAHKHTDTPVMSKTPNYNEMVFNMTRDQAKRLATFLLEE